MTDYEHHFDRVRKTVFSKRLDPRRVPLVYHYTSLDGLRGILQSRTVWATGHRHLNDPAELQIGFQMFAGVLEEKTSLPDGFRRSIVAKMRAEAESPRFDAFVCSFSASADILPMWSQYADYGRGAAIAFRLGEFGDLTNSSGLLVGPVIARVVYSSRKSSAVIEEVVDALAQEAQKLLAANGGDEDVIAQRLFQSLMISAAASSPQFKSRPWNYEREWRLISIGLPSEADLYKSRESRLGRSRYLELPWKDTAVDHIIAGPAAGDGLAELQRLAASVNAPVRRSQLRLRAPIREYELPLPLTGEIDCLHWLDRRR